jgi:hypothetical protein
MEERGILNKGDTISYAFGQGISTYRGVKAIEHSGGDAGYRSHLLRFPEQKYSIVVLSNLGSFNPQGVAYKIADICLKEYLKESPKKQEVKQPVAANIKVSEALLKLYEGQYMLNNQMMVSFKVENGKFMAQASGQPALVLVPSSESEFFIEGLDLKFAFNKASDNTVNQFTLYQGGQTIIAPRVKPIELRSEDREAFTGTYYSSELQTSYMVVIESDTLIVKHIRHEPTELIPVGKDAFSTNAWFMSKIEFIRNEKSEITGFKASSGRVKNVRFLKKEL